MGILKYIERVKRMDDLIRRKATGNASEFAQKLGISRSVLMENIMDLRELGAPIIYDDYCCSYRYEGDFKLFTPEWGSNLKGGYADPGILFYVGTTTA